MRNGWQVERLGNEVYATEDKECYRQYSGNLELVTIPEVIGDHLAENLREQVGHG